MALPVTNVAVLGSTGSIGQSTIEVVSSSHGALQIVALSAHRRLEELCQQAQRLLPRYVIATDEEFARHFDWSALPRQTELVIGQAGLERIVQSPEVDVVVAAVVGSAGLRGTWAALEAGKHVIVEKPMCYTLREADTLISTARRCGRHLMVGYMKRHDPGYLYGRQQVHQIGNLRCVQINVLHPAETLYFAHHRIKRFNDVPAKKIEALQSEWDQLAVEAIGPVSQRLRFLYQEVFLGSMVHDVNALQGILGRPDRVLFTTIWPEDVTYPTITTVLAYDQGPRVIFTWSYLPELRDYFEELAFLGEASRVRIQFPSPFLKHFPTPVEVQGMENGVEWRKRVNVSYAEAFKEDVTPPGR